MRYPTIASVIFLIVAGCAGSKNQIDDSVLAGVPLEEKAGVLGAQNELTQAKAEQENAKANLKAMETDHAIARNETKSSKLQLDNARLNMKSDRGSGDLNRTGNSDRDVKVNELRVNANTAKEDWLAKKRRWLERTADAAEAHMAAAQAKVELEKAKVAEAKKIRPSENFNVMSFESANLDKQKRYLDARMAADKLRADVDSAEQDYRSQQSLLDRAK